MELPSQLEFVLKQFSLKTGKYSLGSTYTYSEADFIYLEKGIGNCISISLSLSLFDSFYLDESES